MLNCFLTFSMCLLFLLRFLAITRWLYRGSRATPTVKSIRHTAEPTRELRWRQAAHGGSNSRNMAVHGGSNSQTTAVHGESNSRTTAYLTRRPRRHTADLTSGPRWHKLANHIPRPDNHDAMTTRLLSSHDGSRKNKKNDLGLQIRNRRRKNSDGGTMACSHKSCLFLVGAREEVRVSSVGGTGGVCH